MPSRVVSLNVGGHVFAESRATLTKFPFSFLAKLVSDDPPEDLFFLDGATFIDRDTDTFKSVPRWLRYEELPETFTSLLEKDAAVYGLSALQQALEQKGASPHQETGLKSTESFPKIVCGSWSPEESQLRNMTFHGTFCFGDSFSAPPTICAQVSGHSGPVMVALHDITSSSCSFICWSPPIPAPPHKWSQDTMLSCFAFQSSSTSQLE